MILPDGNNLSIGYLPPGASVASPIGKNGPMSGQKLRDERKRRKITLEGLAEMTGLSAGFISRMEAGKRGAKLEHKIKIARALAVPLAAIQDDTDYEEPGEATRTVPIMGYIGADEEIEPGFEQVPPEGLAEVELPFAVADEMIGFQVRGDSMWPAYRDGDVIVVPREQQRATEQLIGDEATIVTNDGRRFLKRVAAGPRRNSFNLESLNARFTTIVGVGIRWANHAGLVVRAREIRRVRARGAA